MSDYKKENVYGSILNGRVPNDGMKINGIEKITYYNPATQKNQTQSYLDMDDIIIPFILRKNAEGKYEFAMEYKYIPAAGKTMLELPAISSMQNRDQYDGEQIEDLLEVGLIDNYGIDMIGYRDLDSDATPVSQSFTNQKVRAVLVYTKQEESENNNLEWFDISSLKNYLANYVGLSSLQTAYVMQSFYEQFQNKEELQGNPTSFKYDPDKINSREPFERHHNIMEHKYRFGVDFFSNEERKEEEAPDAEIGLSKNSVQCIMTRVIDGKICVGLSKQQRSPFIATENFDEYLYEIVAGMVEPGESYEEAAKREAIEETGIDIDKQKLSYLGTQLLSTATQEESAFYLCEVSDKSNYGKQNLDSDENISKIEWFPIDDINLSKLHAPLPTKFAILKAREYFCKAKEKKVLEQKSER